MKDLIIVGAGHLGLDIYDLACAINIHNALHQWRIKGFLNDIPVDLSRFQLPMGILGTIEDWVPSENEVFALAIGSPAGKERVADKLKRRGASFETLISPTAGVNRTAVVEEGSIVFGGALIAACARIGKFCSIGHSSIIGYDAQIGDYSNTAAFVNVYQDAIIGRRCQIWSQAVVLKSVGDDAVVGACSCVARKVKSGATVFGVPAVRIDE